MENIGIIGFGHLGSAIAAGLLNSKRSGDIDLEVFDIRSEALDAQSALTRAASAQELAETCGMIFLCVRPADANAVLASLEAPGKVIISTVAGLAAADVAAATGAHVLRIMPNMAVSLGKGAVACAQPHNLTSEELERAQALLSRLGKTVFVPEDALAAVTGLSGSGPAYCYELLEGMVKGARLCGLDEDVARELATQTMIGAGSIVQTTDEPLEKLINGVATPGGTTEAGVRVLETGSFVDLAADAVQAAARRAAELTDGTVRTARTTDA